MRAQLIPGGGGPPIELVKDLTLVGRKEDCDIQLDHKSISKQHCVIVKTDGLLLLRDLGSTNGTRVNGQRVRRAALLPNDHLNIASLRYKVKFEGGDTAAIGPDDFTQQLDAKDIERLLRRNTSPMLDEDDDEDSEELNKLPPIQTNALPDTYDDKPDKKK